MFFFLKLIKNTRVWTFGDYQQPLMIGGKRTEWALLSSAVYSKNRAVCVFANR
jgi:hypothetical protein